MQLFGQYTIRKLGRIANLLYFTGTQVFRANIRHRVCADDTGNPRWLCWVVPPAHTHFLLPWTWNETHKTHTGPHTYVCRYPHTHAYNRNMYYTWTQCVCCVWYPTTFMLRINCMVRSSLCTYHSAYVCVWAIFLSMCFPCTKLSRKALATHTRTYSDRIRCACVGFHAPLLSVYVGGRDEFRFHPYGLWLVVYLRMHT